MYLTRRHWWWAVLGAVLLVGARVAWEVPAVRAAGAQAYAPTWFLIWRMDDLPAYGPAWPQELFEARLRRKPSAALWRGVLARAATTLERADADERAVMMAADVVGRAQGEWLNAAAYAQPGAGGVHGMEEIVARAATALTERLADQSPRVRARARYAVTQLRTPALKPALPRLLAMVAEPHAGKGKLDGTDINAAFERPEGVRHVLIEQLDRPLPASVGALAALGPRATWAEQEALLRPVVGDADWRARVVGLWAMDLLAPEGFDRMGMIRDVFAKEAHPAVRSSAAALLSRAATPAVGGGNEEASSLRQQMLESLLGDAEGAVRGAALEALRTRPPPKAEVQAVVMRMATSDDMWWIRRQALANLAAWRADPETVLVPALRTALADPMEDVREAAARLVPTLGPAAAALRNDLLRLATTAGPTGVRMTAATQLVAAAPCDAEVRGALLGLAMERGLAIQIRYAAVRALGACKEGQAELAAALQPLTDPEQEPDGLMRTLTRTAIERLEGKASK